MGSVSDVKGPEFNPVNPTSIAAEPCAPICVLGLGLIGGSLLRDLGRLNWPAYGWNRSEKTVTRARRDGFDASSDLEATLRRAEEDRALLVLGVPMFALSSLLDAIKIHAPTCGFTDVTSVKEEVHDLVEDHGLSHRFVGGHPMAGTANSGWPATMSGLFKGAVWVVTYDNAVAGDGKGNGSNEAEELWLNTWARVVAMAEAVGSSVVPARARKHDGAVARVSHLPHILAEALAIAGDQGGPLALTLAASSFRDGTRVAGTEPALVRAMCENNRAALVTALDETLELLREAREELANPERNMKDLTEVGHAARGRFEARAGRKKGEGPNRPIIRVQPGGRGWVDQLESAESMGAQIGIF
ncbi:prephenate dehydrogenase [uncultured Corynebacterium sp.]|uniref:prephenate dehydrogenase n=1 Tax=uncultured Corynebacterium sp. TaxID=159447 RepID=UPI0025E04AC1|nr:prephenate dehydrogenase [uncultured Corynebacterium sp.]